MVSPNPVSQRVVPSLALYKEEIITHSLILRSLILARTSTVVHSLPPIRFEVVATRPSLCFGFVPILGLY